MNGACEGFVKIYSGASVSPDTNNGVRKCAYIPFEIDPEPEFDVDKLSGRPPSPSRSDCR